MVGSETTYDMHYGIVDTFLVLLSSPMLYPLGEDPEDFVFQIFLNMKSDAPQLVKVLLSHYIAQLRKQEPTHSFLFYFLQQITSLAGILFLSQKEKKEFLMSFFFCI